MVEIVLKFITLYYSKGKDQDTRVEGKATKTADTTSKVATV
jgi:hypothetical protein